MRKTASVLITLTMTALILLTVCGCDSKKKETASNICTAFCEDVKTGDADKLITYFRAPGVTADDLKEII